MDRGLPPESLNKVLLDVALQKHDQSRVAVSSTQSLPSANTSTSISMPSDTTLTSPAHNTQYMRNSSHTERQTTTTTITTAAASTSKVDGSLSSLVPGCHSLYPPSSYTHSNLPTQFSTAPNSSGKGPSYVLDSHLHNLATSSGASPLYTNLAGVAKSYSVGEPQHSYNALSQNKLSTEAFNNTQTHGYNSSQSYNNNTQSYNNATHDNNKR